jgi:hypothetical protein
MAYVPPRRYRIRWYIRDGVEGRIKGEDLIEIPPERSDTIFTKEIAAHMADTIIEKGESRIFRNFFKAHYGCVAPENWKVTSVKEIPLTKYEILVRTVNEVIDQYDMPLTLRQIYYRLVAKQVIPNTINEYKGLSRNLVKARENGDVDYTRIEDRTRTTIGGDSSFDSLEEYLEWRVDQLFNSHKYLDLAMWENQEHFIEIWVEKDALSRTVSSIGNRFNVRTCPSKGYPSFSYVKKAAERLEDVKHDSIIIIYLGDYDPSGLDIPRDLHKRLVRYGVPYDKIEIDRIALTLDQIEEHNLPPAPAKRSDVRFQSFVDRTGSDDVVELDALEPPILQEILRKSIEGYIDAKKWNERVNEINEEKERLKEMLMDTEIKIPDFEYRFKWDEE